MEEPRSGGEYSDFEPSDFEGGPPDTEAVCPICLEVPERGTKLLLACRHCACLPCIGGWLRSRIRSRRVRPEDLSCPTCRGELGESAVREALAHQDTDGVYEVLQDLRARECALQGSPRSLPVQCPTPDCVIVLVPRGAAEGTCPQCGVVFCASCGHHAHPWLTCAENRARLFQHVLGEVFCQCPQCGEGCEHAGGCHFMTCRCRAHFCHLCGVVLADAQHFSHYQGFAGAEGPFGPVCQNQQRAGRQRAEQASPVGGGQGMHNRPGPPDGARVIRMDHPALQAVAQALQDGVPMPQVLQAVAQARLHQLHIPLQALVQQVLARAVQTRDLPSLRDAVTEARQVGLEHVALEEAEGLLTAEDQRKARVVLQKAVDKRDRAALKEALAECQAVGLNGEELAHARSLLREECLDKARKAVSRAMKSRNAGTLYRAIVEGKSLGLQGPDLEEAETMLKRMHNVQAGPGPQTSRGIRAVPDAKKLAGRG